MNLASELETIKLRISQLRNLILQTTDEDLKEELKKELMGFEHFLKVKNND
jgi:hypothetical protein